MFCNLPFNLGWIIAHRLVSIQVLFWFRQPTHQVLHHLIELQYIKGSKAYISPDILSNNSNAFEIVSFSTTLFSIFIRNQWIWWLLTWIASLYPRSRCRVRSALRDTIFSQRCWTLDSRFLMMTTSCFWLKYFRCVPVLSRRIICSRWVAMSFCSACFK